jgi:sugar/nucleoside kinase (ribokinase family)
MYLEEGRELETLFRRVKERRLTTSLDMVMTDRRSEAAKVNWASVLRRVLPFVEVFLPSLDEMRMVFGNRATPGEVCRRLRRWGPGIVGLKPGSRGLQVSWGRREWREPCFNVKVAGTTGADDCTIAGFLAGLLQGLPSEKVATMAVRVGACSCEAADATSGVLSWD